MRDRGWGRVVHITGAGGWIGMWNRIPHSVGEGGLHTLTKCLAQGLGQYGTTVNDVSPGVVGTVRDTEAQPGLTRERLDEIAQTIPIRRPTTPEEVAWRALFCARRARPRSRVRSSTSMALSGCSDKQGRTAEGDAVLIARRRALPCCSKPRLVRSRGSRPCPRAPSTISAGEAVSRPPVSRAI
jgi:hypothetical protein